MPTPADRWNAATTAAQVGLLRDPLAEWLQRARAVREAEILGWGGIPLGCHPRFMETPAELAAWVTTLDTLGLSACDASGLLREGAYTGILPHIQMDLGVPASVRNLSIVYTGGWLRYFFEWGPGKYRNSLEFEFNSGRCCRVNRNIRTEMTTAATAEHTTGYCYKGSVLDSCSGQDWRVFVPKHHHWCIPETVLQLGLSLGLGEGDNFTEILSGVLEPVTVQVGLAESGFDLS